MLNKEEVYSLLVILAGCFSNDNTGLNVLTSSGGHPPANLFC